MGWDQEVRRIEAAYAARDAEGKAALYAWWRPDVLLAGYRLRAATARLLRAEGLHRLSELEILDVGCGGGGWLLTLLQSGADPAKMHGVEVLGDRIARARRSMPQLDLQLTEGFPLPYPDGSMNLVFAHTVFSSVLSPSAREELAREMLRVTAGGGAILVYDFRISHPRNPDAVAIRIDEVRRLFAGSPVVARSLTLAPPLGRPLARLAPWLALSAESCFPFLRTHALYLIRQGR